MNRCCAIHRYHHRRHSTRRFGSCRPSANCFASPRDCHHHRRCHTGSNRPAILRVDHIHRAPAIGRWPYRSSNDRLRDRCPTCFHSTCWTCSSTSPSGRWYLTGSWFETCALHVRLAFLNSWLHFVLFLSRPRCSCRLMSSPADRCAARRHRLMATGRWLRRGAVRQLHRPGRPAAWPDRGALWPRPGDWSPRHRCGAGPSRWTRLCPEPVIGSDRARWRRRFGSILMLFGSCFLRCVLLRLISSPACCLAFCFVSMASLFSPKVVKWVCVTGLIRVRKKDDGLMKFA